MEVFQWSGSSLQGFIEAAGIIGALVFSGVAFLLNARAQRLANSIRLTESHRILWERLILDPQLGRVLDPNLDSRNVSIAPSEKMFVVLVILHLSNTYYATKSGLLRTPEGVSKDIKRFFGLPIPRAIWVQVRDMQERAFADFVEECLSPESEP